MIDEALDTVEAVATREFWREARATAECHEEAPFAVRDMAGPARRHWHDRSCLSRGEGWRLIDYKTDVDPGNTEAQRKYDEQVRWYASAWGRVASGRVAASIVAARKPRGRA